MQAKAREFPGNAFVVGSRFLTGLSARFGMTRFDFDFVF
jgi:hypothetical protein